MMHAKLKAFRARLRQEFPVFEVVVRAHTNQDDPTIRHFVHVLDVPAEQLHTVAMRAFDLAFDVYGNDPLPFHLTTVDVATSNQYFRDANASERDHRALRVVPVFAISFEPAHIAMRLATDSSTVNWPDFSPALAARLRFSLDTPRGAQLDPSDADWLRIEGSSTRGARIEPVTEVRPEQSSTVHMICPALARPAA